MTGPSPHDRSATLESLVFETLERMEREGAAAIESAVSNHPDLEQALRTRLGALQSMGLIPVGDGSPLAVPSSLGNYEIGERIGEGGMGLVFQARDTVLDRDVALKLIRPELVASSSLRERFTRESLAVARLQHPAVGRIFDAGELAGFPFMAMEYIPGCTLSQVLDKLDGRAPESLTGRDFQACVEELSAPESAAPPHAIQPPSPAVSEGLFAGTWGETCMRIGLAVAEGLSCAHAAAVLHRDVKASNVMITPGGRVILIDFGLAQLDSAAKLTTTGGRIGSLPYIAPERVVDASPATESADLYGLGVLLYELCTLRLPFRASSEAALVKLIAHSQPEPLKAANPGLAPLFREVTERAMRRDPKRRPPSAADYAVDLSRVLAGQPPHPHGDGPVAALRSRWRAQPVITAALVTSGLLLLLLPAALMSVQVSAAERTTKSDELSVARLGLALQAADELQHTLPITDVIDGTPVGKIRADVLRTLVDLRATILADPRFASGSLALQVEAALSQSDALLRLDRPEEARSQLLALDATVRELDDPELHLSYRDLKAQLESAESKERVQVAERLIASVHDRTAPSIHRATLQAAYLALELEPNDDASEAIMRDSVKVLRGSLNENSHSIDTKALLADLFHELAVLDAKRGAKGDARAQVAEALALARELHGAMPDSKPLAGRVSDWSAFERSLAPEALSTSEGDPR